MKKQQQQKNNIEENNNEKGKKEKRLRKGMKFLNVHKKHSRMQLASNNTKSS